MSETIALKSFNYTSTSSLEKRVLIDYLTVNIDDFDIRTTSSGNYYINDTDSFYELLKFFGYNGTYSEMPKALPLHGFTEGFRIGEYVRISFGGEHIKNANGNYVLSVEMSGSACREFENYMNGSWQDLLTFVFSRSSFRISRIDLAIDDFQENEITLFEIKKLLEDGLFSSSARKVQFNYGIEKIRDVTYSNGLTMYLGTKSSNQLRIYDKRAERNSAGEADLDTDIWNRYEMQFKGDKALLVTENYLLGLIGNDNFSFMNFTKGLLYDFLDLKDPKDKNTRIRRKETYNNWSLFLDSVEKVNMKLPAKIDTTISVKKVWHKRSITSTDLEFALSMGVDEWQSYLYDNMIDKIDELPTRSLTRINNYRIEKGLEKIDLEYLKRTKVSLETVMEIQKEYSVKKEKE